LGVGEGRGHRRRTEKHPSCWMNGSCRKEKGYKLIDDAGASKKKKGEGNKSLRQKPKGI